MMNIGVAISGNLTGFSRFYANDEAKKLLNSIKFNFDVHNLVSFLNNGEKLYAIFFSKDIVAVSLITNILDSFRRPGNLVVTVLIPRGYKIVDGLSLSGVNALYNLLNELNDKFYERNFLNGMINQNPAVLMQDYYTEILSKFRLEPDRSQRKINGLIDVTSPNKKTGYVSALERNIPSYLSSLFRKSYEGYHHIFIASNAPQNVDEPAEEIVTYKVKVSNDNRLIHGEVRLDDRIPNVSPQQGEMPIPNQNYTYRQVLNGEAGNEIIASIENDTIVLTYRFQQEEKTVYFKFYDGANEVPLHVIRPFIEESNGSSYPLSTDSWTFRGKEIYGLKTIKSGNPDYTIESHSTHLDLKRIREGATHNAYVGKGWIWYFNPFDKLTGIPVTIHPVDIVLENRVTGESRKFSRVTSAFSEHMSGNENDWIMKITSDYYEPITCSPNGKYDFIQKKQTQPSHKGERHVKDFQRGGTQTRTQGHSSNQNLTLTGGANDTATEQAHIEAEKKKRLALYSIFAIVAIILCIGGWWGYYVWNKGKDKNNDSENFSGSTWVTKNVIFSLGDGSTNSPEIQHENLALLDVTVESNSVKIEDGENAYSKAITYNPHNDNDTVIIKVIFNKIGEGQPLTFAFERFTVNELNEGINPVVLSVKNSELTSFRELEAGIIPTSLKSQITRLSGGDKDMQKYAMHLVNLKNGIENTSKNIAETEDKANKEREAATQKATADDDRAKKEAEAKTQTKAPKFEISWTLPDVRSKKGKEEYKEYDKQLTAIDKCLTSLKAGKVNIPDNLPSNFVQVLTNLKDLESRINSINDIETQNELKQIFKEEIQKKSESVNKEQDNLVGTCKLQNKIRNAERRQNNQ